MKHSGNLLYKYFPYNEYLLETLSTKKIWYSKPDTFNDPFDCHLNFDPHIPEDRYEKCLRWQLKREGRSQSQIDEDIKKLISENGIVNEDARCIIDGIAASTLDVIKRIGVLCLAESNTDVTMWAHYADNHKGLCLGFLISVEASPEKVTYVAEAPIVNFSELLDEQLDANEYKWIFSKHHDWRNEREWRVVVPEGNQLWPIPGRIRTVVFGLRMDKSKKEVVKQILKDAPDVQYFEAVRNPGLLQLEIKRV
jgi:Protein of unknown function (DUF2971)